MPDNSPLSRRELISLIDAIVSGAREINKYKLTERQKNFYHSSHMACLSLVKYAPAMVRQEIKRVDAIKVWRAELENKGG